MDDSLAKDVQEANFDYESLPVETREFVKAKESSIKARTSQTIWENGRDLLEVKGRLEHGLFMEWCKASLPWSKTTVADMMNVAKQFPNFRNSEISKSVLYLLAAPSTPESARDEALERAESGEKLSTSETKEVISRHKKGELIEEFAEMMASGQMTKGAAGKLSQLDLEGQIQVWIAFEDRARILELKDVEIKQARDDYDQIVLQLDDAKIKATENETRAERLAAEVEQVKRDMGVKDKRIANLHCSLQDEMRKNAEVVEKVVEVIPEDYEEVKRTAEERVARLEALNRKLSASQADVKVLEGQQAWVQICNRLEVASIMLWNATLEVPENGDGNPMPPPESFGGLLKTLSENMERLNQAVFTERPCES